VPTVSKSIDIPAPPDEVWRTVTDIENSGEWNVVHVSFPDGAPPLSASASWKEKVRIMGMPGEVTWSVAELDDGTELQLTGKGPMGTKLRAGYVLEAVDGGTRLTADSEFGGVALKPMLGPVTKESEKALDASLENLRALLA
jgi:hypothetical protein